jgi:hypothetical protein
LTILTSTPVAIGSKTQRIAATLIALFGAGFFFVLRTQHWDGDGIRWYPTVVFSPRPLGGGGNHLLYPVLQWAWVRMVTLGHVPAGFAGAVDQMAALNAVAGGVATGALWMLLNRLGCSVHSAAMGTLLFGSSAAVLLQSTDLVEPMSSVGLVIITFVITAGIPGSPRPLIRSAAAGMVMGLAIATYEASVLTMPGALLLASRPPAGAPTGVAALRSMDLRRAAYLVAASLATTAAAFVLSVPLFDVPGSGEVVGNATAGVQGYGSLNPIHYIALPFGFTNALSTLEGWHGASRILDVPRASQVHNLVALAIALTLGVLGVFGSWRARARSGWTLVAMLGWFVPSALFAGYYANTYIKFWVEPVAAFACVLGLAWPQATAPWRRVVGALVVALALFNVVTVAGPAHFESDDNTRQARALSEVTGPRDLVLGLGWDPTGIRYKSLSGRNFISYIDLAYTKNLNAPATNAALLASVCSTIRQGGPVYSLDLLTHERKDWDSYIGPVLHLPFDGLAPIRRAASSNSGLPALADQPEKVVAVADPGCT